MKRSTLQHHKEAAKLCEEKIIIAEMKSAFLIPQSTKQKSPPKAYSNTWKFDKYCTNYGMNTHNVETLRKKEET
jgi:hypothetical protein